MITRISEEKCTGCGVCVEMCPLDTIRLSTAGKAFIAYPEDCMTCYLCEMHCSNGAIYVHPCKELMPRALPNTF